MVRERGERDGKKEREEERRKGRSRGREEHYVPQNTRLQTTIIIFMLHMSTGVRVHMSTGVRVHVYTP